MSSRIKGIVVEIGGDTQSLQNAIKDVEKRSNGLAKELKDVERLLKMNPGNIELISQKQQLLTDRIAATTEKLDGLKAAQAQVEAQFQSGDIGIEQYRAFQRELVTTEGSLNGLRNQLQRMTDEQERVADSTRQLGTFFQATGTDIEQFADTLGSNLTNAIRNGTASSQQLEQALDQIGQAALGADADLGRMREALRNADNGASLDQVRQDLNQITQEAGEAETAIRDFGGELSQTVGGLVAGGGIAGVVSAALDTSSLDTKIEIMFDVPEESKATVKAAIREVGTYGIEAEEALEGVRRQWVLNKDASDESNAAVVKGASLIASKYASIDFTELIQEANEIGASLNISNEEAMGMVNTLLDLGFPPEQLDIIAEYGEQLAIAGYNAEEVQNILEASVKTKTWNIDDLLDGLKEAKIGITEFGLEIPKAMDELLAKTDISSKQMQAWGAAVAGGGEEGSAAMVEVAKALAGVEDATLRNELGVQVFGTKFENQGMKLVDTLMVAENGTANLGEGIQKLNDNIATMDEDPAVKLQEALQNMMKALEPILTKVAEMITVFATWASENPVLLATITAVTTVLGILMGVFAALAPIISLIINNFALIRTAFMALSGPIGIAIAAIIAIGVALYKNWDVVQEYVGKVSLAFKAVKAAITTALEGASKVVSSVLKTISTTFKNILEGIKTTVSSIFNGIKSYITGVLNDYKNAFSTAWNAIKSAVSSSASAIWNTVKNNFNNMLNAVRNTMNSVKSAISEIWNSALNIFKSSSLFNIGKDMISGLIRGIKSMTKTAIGAITGVVDGVINKAKSLLKIKSPSRVFMEIGEFTNEGFIKGIEKTSNQIANTMGDVYGNLGTNAKRMTAQNTPSIPTTNNNVTNSMPINISLNYSGNASEADAMRMVDIIETQLGNRLNSRMRMSGVR